jgi:hypothetical protein
MDPLSVTASVVGVAGAGIQLATTLYAFSDSVLKADKSVRVIADDVALTSQVLSELGILLRTDSAERLVSLSALETADKTVKGCQECFQELNEAVEKLLGKDKGKERDLSGGMSVWNRIKWPLLEPKMRLLQANLERLKSTLLLMLQVITYARILSGEYVLRDSISFD